MAIASANPTFSAISNTGPRPQPNHFLEAQSQNQNNIPRTVTKNAPLHEKKAEHFLFGMYSDFVKTLWKILSGAMVTEVLRGILKTDSNFSIGKIIDKSFRVDFISRFIADFGGALTVRLFNGKTKLLGMLMPKVHTAISSQLFSNLFVKFWRSLSSSDNLNQLSADGPRNDAAAKAIARLENAGWIKVLKKMDSFYKNKLDPSISWVLSKAFGIKPGKKLPNGEKTDAKVNWFHFLTVGAASAVGTWFLPRNTQVFGFEDVHESKDGFRTLINSAITWALTSLVRLENYIFNNAVTVQAKGYGYDACMKIAVREKGFIPMAQYACDNIAAICSKVLPVNGAFLSSMIRLPVEIVTTFLTSSLVGISKGNRVQDHWIYLADKVMKPVSKVVEDVSSPVFVFLNKIFYTPFFGFFEKDFEAVARPYDEDKTVLPKEREEEMFKRLGHKSTTRLFLKSVLWDWWTKDVWQTIRESLQESKEAKASGKTNNVKAKKTSDED